MPRSALLSKDLGTSILNIFRIYFKKALDKRNKMLYNIIRCKSCKGPLAAFAYSEGYGDVLKRPKRRPC